jgi:hypothetical protein
MSVQARLAVLLLAGFCAVTVTGVAAAGSDVTKVRVTFTDRHFVLSPAGLQAGKTMFLVSNTGEKPHAFAIAGPGLKLSTPKLGTGRSATLTVTLRVGAYALSDAVGSATGHWLVVGPATVVHSTGTGTGGTAPETSTIGMNCD